jgi:hypothetical protein
MDGRNFMLGIIGLMCSSGLALANCDITDFDQTPPPAFKLDVNNQFATFQWASDADALNGRTLLWHYIWNRSPNKGLAVKWDKVRILQPPAAALPPGEVACVRRFVEGVRDRPDYDAPIRHGLQQFEHREDATLYVQDEKAAQATGNNFDTAYIDQQGKKIDVSVGVYSERVGNEYHLELEVIPNLTIAISELPDRLTKSELVSFAAGAGAQRITMGLRPLDELGLADLGEVFSASELASHLKQDYLFFRGTQKTVLALTTPTVEKIKAEIIVLDRTRVIFVADVEVLAPKR